MATKRPSADTPGDVVRSHQEMVEMNEALILGAVRQHESAEAAPLSTRKEPA